MDGSTLYRRLPDGTWASEREDIPTGTDAPGEVPSDAADSGGQRSGVAPAVAVAAAVAMSGPATPAAGVGAAADAGPAADVGAATAAPAAAPVAPAPEPADRKERRRRGPVRRWLRRIVIVLAIAVGAYAIWLAALLIHAATSLNRIEALSPAPIADTDGQVWLMVGSDSREGLTPEEQKELHTGDDEGQRTDTIMVVRMVAGQAPQLVSLPRDSWVTIPAYDASDGSTIAAHDAKINSAFSLGGAPLLSQTVEYNTGLHVDHYMEIGMQGIVALTDAVGGIEVCFDEPIQDENSGLDVEAGCQTLNGEEALAWVRMRYADPKGDIGRIERQQEYIKLIMEEILSWETLTHPGRQLDIVNAVVESIKVDLETASLELGRFGLGMGRLATGAGEVGTVPLVSGNHMISGQSVVLWDEQEAEQLFASMGGHPPQAI